MKGKTLMVAGLLLALPIATQAEMYIVSGPEGSKFVDVNVSYGNITIWDSQEGISTGYIELDGSMCFRGKDGRYTWILSSPSASSSGQTSHEDLIRWYDQQMGLR